jgi:hypothetical protein
VARKIDQKGTGITIKFYCEPELKDPCMLAAWPGMGNVAYGVAKYLRDKLKAELFGELELGEFFQFSGVSVKDDGTVETPGLTIMPKNKFYYWKNEGSGSDMIIFIGEAQPSGMEYEVANKVVEVGEKFKVKRIYTAAAFALSARVNQESKVHVVATSIELIEDLKKFDLRLMTDGSISGLNGLLLGIAKNKGIESICLLGEMPNYLTHIEYPKASHAVLSILTEILNIKIDLNEILALAKYQEEEIKKHIKKIEEQMRQLQLQQALEEETPKTWH